MKHRTRIGSVAFDAANYGLLFLFTVLCLYPFYYVFIYSMSLPGLATGRLVVLPAGVTFNNYVEVFKLKGLLPAFILSVARTISGTLLIIACCSFFGYIVTKKELALRTLIYRYMVITMYLSAGLIPVYLTMKMYGLRNNFLVYILPGALSAFYVILFKTYIEQLPASLEESAVIDGAGYFTVFTRIIFPLAKPIVATIAVFAAVGHWNSWFDNYIYCPVPQLTTLQLVLFKYLQEVQRIVESLRNADSSQVEGAARQMRQLTPQTIRMTITMVVTFPILLVYPFLQRFFVKGIMLGAIKG